VTTYTGLRRLAGFTITAADPAAAAALYVQHLGYQVVDEGTIGAETAANWRAPNVVRRKFVEVTPSPTSNDDCFIRFVEQVPTPDIPLLGYGWNGVEISCRDPYALADQFSGTPFRVIVPPRPLPFDNDFHAMQVIGPAGELLYFTAVPDKKSIFDLRVADRRVDEPFIAILAGPDATKILEFYRDVLRTPTLPTSLVDIQVVNDVFGLPSGTMTPLGIVKLPARYLIEVDEHPAASKPRPRRPRELPPGIAMVSFDVGRLRSGQSTRVLEGPAGEWLELPTPN